MSTRATKETASGCVFWNSSSRNVPFSKTIGSIGGLDPISICSTGRLSAPEALVPGLSCRNPHEARQWSSLPVPRITRVAEERTRVAFHVLQACRLLFSHVQFKLNAWMFGIGGRLAWQSFRCRAIFFATWFVHVRFVALSSHQFLCRYLFS